MKKTGLHHMVYFLGLPGLLLPFTLLAQPLFDTHLHYSESDAHYLGPQAVIRKLDANGILFAAVTGSPAEYVRELYEYAPERIVPLLSVYRKSHEKESWTKDASLPAYVEQELRHGYWRGIGELHIFASDRHSQVFRKIIGMASRWQLPVLIHGDPAVIDTVFELNPRLPVIWAHASTFPYPDLVADYLHRYPLLMVDLSKRDERIAPDGDINDAWYELFVSFPDRFLVGVDTYSPGRWNEMGAVTEKIRIWLKQLPEDVARKLAYDNAAKLFSRPD